MNPPIKPGEILLEKYLWPMAISHNAMARAIGVAILGTPSSSSAPQSAAREEKLEEGQEKLEKLGTG